MMNFSRCFCGISFFDEQNYTEHLDSHSDSKICEVCNRKILKHNYRRHMLMHRRGRRFTCEVCSKTFYKRRYLHNHMRRSAAKNKYNCEDCKANFHRKTDYLLHMKKMHMQQCCVCSKEFVDEVKLSRHLVSHTGQTSFL